MLLLEQDITRKDKVNKLFLAIKSELKASKEKKFKMKIIQDNTVYANETTRD